MRAELQQRKQRRVKRLEDVVRELIRMIDDDAILVTGEHRQELIKLYGDALAALDTVV